MTDDGWHWGKSHGNGEKWSDSSYSLKIKLCSISWYIEHGAREKEEQRMSTMVLARPSGKMEPPPTEMGRLQMEQVLEREEGGLGSGDQELSSKF